MEERGFGRLLGRDIDVIELTADGASDEDLTALADVLDDMETEQKAAELATDMRRMGLLW